jgi:cytochrome d ubiquinol oxidase subunit II
VHLYELPLCFVLGGVVLYVVLGGADFGAGLWAMTAGPNKRVREHAHHAMAAVWEANHVWLVFVLTVFWTAYPEAFGSIASTLSVALFVAGLGIIVRGAAYALRAGASARRELHRIDAASGISSVLTPFALGAAAGGIASGRVPVGNAEGDLVTSWLNPTSITIGVIAVATSAYLAAVYLAADSARVGDRELVEHFRRRALGAGVVAGAVAAAGLVVLHGDAHRLYRELVAGDGLPALVVSALAGLATIALVWRERFEAARYSAALAVAAVIVGWALAQSPVLLPGLSIRAAAAPHDTLVAVVVAVLAGGAILFPSLALLFRLTLTGRFDEAAEEERVAAPASRRSLAGAPPLLARVAIASLVVCFGFLTVAEGKWPHAIGVVALFVFLVTGFLAVAPAQLAAAED